MTVFILLFIIAAAFYFFGRKKENGFAEVFRYRFFSFSNFFVSS